ncbi:MAG TPA: hypothetical protein VNF07_09615 [Acidimicrobiales bacterium]|nr:hypothetical protein [Acidimicrobiales bacterium]
MHTATLHPTAPPAGDLRSCSGTVIVHPDRGTECTDDAHCEVPLFAHEFTSLCDDPTCCGD